MDQATRRSSPIKSIAGEHLVHVLTVYESRGQAALGYLEARQTTEALELLRLRDAGFANLMASLSSFERHDEVSSNELAFVNELVKATFQNASVLNQRIKERLAAEAMESTGQLAKVARGGQVLARYRS